MRSPHDLVLVGGGHAHVQVLRRLAMDPLPDVRLTLVVDDPVAVYSGMVPGFVAGQYARDDLEIDVRPLARRARARVIVSAARGVDPAARRIQLTDRPTLPYDTVCFDVGSRVAGLDTPGVREHALTTRPIGRFVARVDGCAARLPAGARIVVVGGGAGGVELAFAMKARRPDAQIELIEAGPRILAGSAPAAARSVTRNARDLGIRLRCDASVAGVEEGGVELADGTSLPCDLVLWVAGAAPLPIFDDSDLVRRNGGFLEVGPTLQATDHPEIFAVGDCAWMRDHVLPRAGVHAVRQGPVLAHNLRARLAGRRLRRHRPQRDFLTLLNLGDGRAIGSKWGLAFEGRAILALKDAIDRRFVRRFQVLDARGRPRPGFPPMTSDGPMPCGGCAAKLGEHSLREALAEAELPGSADVVLGPASADDAVAIRHRDGTVDVANLDTIRAFCDDAYLVGRVAAENAVSDLHATGATPHHAMAQVQLPESPSDRPAELLKTVLAGARAAFEPIGVGLLGGHTTVGESLSVGFAVWGQAPDEAALLRLGGLRAGDRLILSKALGTGVLLRADMLAEAAGPWIEAAVASMLRSNASAARIARETGARAVTDVSGFGLAGHLLAMLRASRCRARLELDRLPLLPGAARLLGRGLRSTFHGENASAAESIRVAPHLGERDAHAVLYDPQTSGGLLFGVDRDVAEPCVARLRAAGDDAAAIVGSVLPRGPEATWIELA